jgi:hypothetical protein
MLRTRASVTRKLEPIAGRLGKPQARARSAKRSAGHGGETFPSARVTREALLRLPRRAAARFVAVIGERKRPRGKESEGERENA